MLVRSDIMKKLIIALLIIFILVAYVVKTNNSLDLKKAEDLKTFIKIYSGWVYSTFSNIKDITSYVTKKEWLPENSENTTNSS